ncbi:hypothetical protein ACLB2K_036158 [Fragaria x ananassa]
MKIRNGESDIAAFENDIHCRLKREKYKDGEINFVYIDEVQDLAMSQIALFKYVCSNVEEGFVFSGDTAQTIARDKVVLVRDDCSREEICNSVGKQALNLTIMECKGLEFELFHEHNYKMAKMCFHKAGDTYWERRSEAAELKVKADHIRTSSPGEANAFLREAALIFDSIGLSVSAARCFYELE